MTERTFELLIDGLEFGEGLRWHEDRLWYSDLYEGAVYAVSLDGSREEICQVPGQPSGLGWLPDGRLLVVSMLEDRIYRREHSGELVVHAEMSGFTIHANDMVVATDGTAYVGHFGYEMYTLPPSERTRVIVGIADDGSAIVSENYQLATIVGVRPDGTVWTAAEGIAFPNGCVITADGRTLIVGESVGQHYIALPLEADGEVRADDRWDWAHVPGTAPDGCSLDADGGIWFADVLRGRLRRVVEGGTITESVKPPLRPFACMLGGPDGRTLFAVCGTGRTAPECAGRKDGAIFTTTVDAPHVGWP